jgi:hemoglobin-like flavoprotein
MDIQQSMNRILEQKETLADLFYLVFLERYPELRPHFERVNMKGQVALLTMALMVMERHYHHSYPATEMYLRYLGTKHHDRHIPSADFPKFRAAMLASLERFHSKDWNPHLARQWAEAIDKASAAMLDGYRHHYSV